MFLSVGAVCALSFATLAGLLVYTKSQLIKKRNGLALTLAMRLRLPSMERLENEWLRSLLLSFGFMSATLVTGLGLSPSLISATVFPKLLAAIGTWALLGGLLIGHYYFGWRGLKGLLLTLAGLFTMLLGYFISKTVFT